MLARLQGSMHEEEIKGKGRREGEDGEREKEGRVVALSRDGGSR